MTRVDDEQQDERDDSGGEVSEVSRMDPAEADTPISPDQATAGAPDAESGAVQEGTAGPNARTRDNRPDNEQ